MKPDDAVRLAATSVADDADVSHARQVVHAFISRLAECSACGGTERITTAREITYNPPTVDGSKAYLIPAGQQIACPRCGPGGDPEYVVWRCREGKTEQVCRDLRTADPDDPDGPHVSCGLHVFVPMDLFAPSGEG